VEARRDHAPSVKQFAQIIRRASGRED